MRPPQPPSACCGSGWSGRGERPDFAETFPDDLATAAFDEDWIDGELAGELEVDGRHDAKLAMITARGVPGAMRIRLDASSPNA
jgi:hypothetical protein